MKDFGSYSKEQIDTLNNANDKLGLSNNMNIERNKNIIFVYSSPKVGSTSLVSSLRLSLNDKYVILHIHNEKMLKSLYDIRDIQVIDIIEYNRYLGKNIHVFDIYRSIMEQRMSLFFENIDTFHFNVSKERLCKYDVQILINRFNKICSHLLITDHFKTYYNVDFPEVFDHDKKYLLLERNGINFVKLRLQDSSEWSLILNRILHEDIIMIKDYQTNDKVIKDVYNNFKLHYKIPENIYNLLVENQELKYYYTDEERSQYLSSWNNKITSSIPYYSEVEYKEDFFADMKRCVALHTGRSWKNRELDIDKWKTVAKWLDDKGYTVLQFGDANTEKVDIGQDLTNLSIRQTAVLMAGCEFFVGIDSLVAHLAKAADIPQVIAYGCTDPNVLKNSDKEYPVWISDLECAGCQQTNPSATYTECDKDKIHCVDLITPKMIIENISKIIETERITTNE